MEDYTTVLKRQFEDLSDIYYLSCALSNEGQKREFHLAGSMTKVVLVATLVSGANAYTTQANDFDYFKKDVPVMVAQNVKTASKVEPLFTDGKGGVEVEVYQAPSLLKQSRKERDANNERFLRVQRVQMILTSYNRNKSVAPISYASRWTMRTVNQALSHLPFTDSILQYDSYDDVWQYNLYFAHQLEVDVSVYVVEGKIDDVDYSIYHHGDLLVANESPLPQLMRQLNSVIAKLDKNA